jgi:hypothetical protein
MMSLTGKLAASVVALAIGGAASATPAASAERIWPVGAHSSGAMHAGGGWRREGGWNNRGGFDHALRGGHRDQGGFGGYGLGLGALGAFGALEGFQAYYNGDCVRYEPVYNRYGRYIGRRAVEVC